WPFLQMESEPFPAGMITVSISGTWKRARRFARWKLMPLECMGSPFRAMAAALRRPTMMLKRSPCGMLKQARSCIGLRDTRIVSAMLLFQPMGVSSFPEGMTNRFECGVFLEWKEKNHGRYRSSLVVDPVCHCVGPDSLEFSG